jgi:hypothetical protein
MKVVTAAAFRSRRCHRALLVLSALLTAVALVAVAPRAYSGEQAASTSSGATERPISLFYRAGDGVAVTGSVDGGGGFANLRTVGGFSVGWTHVVPVGMGLLLFYRSGDGVAVTGRADGAGRFVSLRGVGGFMAGWTHIVPVGGGRLLFYRSGDGAAVTGRVDDDGAFVMLRGVGPFQTGWAHIVPAGGGQLLFYRSGDGTAVTGRVDNEGGFATLRTVGGFQTGWTHIAAVGGGRLLFYRSGDGTAVTGRVDDGGGFVTLRTVGGFQTGWTQVVPAGGGRLLFYRSGDGTAVTGRVDDGGGFATLRTVGEFQTGWTHIADPFTDSQDFLITAGTPRNTFVQRIGAPGAAVRIAGDVNLDLSGLENIRVAPGVQIIGDRTVNPRGPRLYAGRAGTTVPKQLLLIGGFGDVSDNVRITGIRLDGGRGTVIAPADATGGTGIAVISSQNVEIDHNEIYGWQSTGVWVDDELGRIDLSNATTVHIHDNYIYRNQHYREEGYGVATHGGAYALIDRNVFDYNRHAIESAGTDGTGYLAYRNLFLTGGGVNSEPGGGAFEVNTHMLDVHGTKDCRAFGFKFVAYCGRAGEYFDIEYNTILYTAGTGFKLRGMPSMRADVGNNVFAHDQVWGGWLDDAAMVGTNDNLGINAWNNQFGLNTFTERKTCDFDGDHTGDPFIATGVTWWYASSRLGGQWVYLNDSRKRVANVTLGDVTGDGRCDVTVDGVVYDNGGSASSPVVSPNPVPDVRGMQLADAVAALADAGYGVGMQFDLFDTGACAHVGEVMDQDPTPGTASLPRGSAPTVNLWVMQMPKSGICN